MYDVVIIGAGPGGYTCALRAAGYGLSVALVEKDFLGGTCLNRGCIPTKTLLHAADLLESLKDAEKYGIRVENFAPDFPALRTRVSEVITTLRGGIEKMMKQKKIDVYRGTGLVKSETCVVVSNEDGETELTTKNIVLATGSVPSVPPIAGADLPGVHTSDTLLAELPEVSSLVIIGGGVIGVEFAEVYQALGATVTILEAMPRIIPPMDSDLSRHLAADFRKKGVKVIAKASVSAITKEGDGLAVHYKLGDKETEVRADAVLIATGRRASVEGLTPFEIEKERGRAVVNEKCQTSVPHVYAIGDIVAGTPQLAHAAEAHARIVAAALAGKPCDIDMKLIPSVVYTKPEVASVGLTEDDAKAQGVEVKIARTMMGGNAKSLIEGVAGYIKIIAAPDGKILGAEFQCHDAANLMSEATLAISKGMTAEELSEIIRPHPSVEEALGETAENMADAILAEK